MEGIKFTPDEASLIEWCLEQMHSDIESSDDLIDYDSILRKIKPFTIVNITTMLILDIDVGI